MTIDGLNYEQQSLFDKLTSQGVPDEWAYLIAIRATGKWGYCDSLSPTEILSESFFWSDTPEGHEFWDGVYLALCVP